MDKLIRYCGFLPGAFFLLLIVFMALIGGLDYLNKVPTIMYINIICLFVAPYFIGTKNHRLVGYIAGGVSILSYIYQGIMDSSHLLFYIGIAVALLIYFLAYDYFLQKTKKL